MLQNELKDSVVDALILCLIRIVMNKLSKDKYIYNKTSIGDGVVKIISVINYKGGVGKTTITSNLAAELSKRDKRVLMVDLDPQTNLTFLFMRVDEWKKNYEKNKTIKYWFDSIIDGRKTIPELKDLIIRNGNLGLICSHLGLIDVDIELAAGLSAGTERQHRNNFVKTYSYLKMELCKMKDDYDLILIDCPPNFSIVTKNALIASDYYLIPSKMDYLSTLGINQLRSNVDKIVNEYNRNCEENSYDEVHPKLLGIVANMVSFRGGNLISSQQNYLSQLISNKIPMFKVMLRENKTLYCNGSEDGKPVVMMGYNSGTYGEVIDELRELTTEFSRKVGL